METGRAGFRPCQSRGNWAAYTIVLKLKTADFRLRHRRSASLEEPHTQLADRIFRVAQAALKREADGTRYRPFGRGSFQPRRRRQCRIPKPELTGQAISARHGTGDGQYPRSMAAKPLAEGRSFT